MAERGCKSCKWEPSWEDYDGTNLIGKCKWKLHNSFPSLPKCTLLSFKNIVYFVKDDSMNIYKCPTWESKE